MCAMPPGDDDEPVSVGWRQQLPSLLSYAVICHHPLAAVVAFLSVAVTTATTTVFLSSVNYS